MWLRCVDPVILPTLVVEGSTRRSTFEGALLRGLVHVTFSVMITILRHGRILRVPHARSPDYL